MKRMKRILELFLIFMAIVNVSVFSLFAEDLQAQAENARTDKDWSIYAYPLETQFGIAYNFKLNPFSLHSKLGLYTDYSVFRDLILNITLTGRYHLFTTSVSNLYFGLGIASQLFIWGDFYFTLGAQFPVGMEFFPFEKIPVLGIVLELIPFFYLDPESEPYNGGINVSFGFAYYLK